MKMPDREEVIKALENCSFDYGYEFECLTCNSFKTTCPYKYPNNCLEGLIKDAVALLKEQETELSYREAKAITHTATKLDDATCPSCGNVVGEKIRTGAIGQSVVQVKWDYCRFCGQKLNWKGRQSRNEID
jgi:transcription elongation factor Elf1